MVRMQPSLSRFVRSFVLLANLKPEAPLSALLATNNEIGRFLRGREHDQTAEVLYRHRGIENIHFEGGSSTRSIHHRGTMRKSFHGRHTIVRRSQYVKATGVTQQVIKMSEL
ncbi:hypothetical protein ANTQUA_LOCUS3249 [Anthophora quadrimaculata]